MVNRSLQELARELDAIIDSSSDGLFVCDAGGRILRVNPASARINNATPEQLEGRNYLDVAREGLVLLPSAALEAIKAKAQVSLLQQSRTGRKLISTATPVFDEQQQLIRVVVSERDISEIERLKRDLEDQQELGNQFRRQLSQLQREQLNGRDVIAESPLMATTLKQARRLSQVDSTVLLLGESGVGKGLIADLIHVGSHRAQQPMIKLNCGAIPESLIEAELFGYERGAFTGAVANKPGQLELADKGTVFLDEIAELPLSAQVKLLRFLEDGRLTRLGATKERQVDVRLIAATNRDLKQRVDSGLFREDLYYRLSVIPIQIPALRQRQECIVPLLNSYLHYFAERVGVRRQLTPAALDRLCTYAWPGNVRELMNLCERLVVMSEGPLIDVNHLPAVVLNNGVAHITTSTPWPAAMSMVQILASVEREVLYQAHKRYGRQCRIAAMLGMSQPTVARKLRHYGIGRFVSE
ncbi:sigma-54 interaction domain-containing protein [Pelovirga terrestris]|uniref:HTH-type transcriptional regulatory protein TyrR n=1 Tax=Pelovirga terrestris TaxID=2771352 RepID=A0A8J6QPT5_9BACT|nr:sigma 54-interacting transcriptional regulator [Pelovirga terrestris]MBD1400601.1 sigma 54-interacting transcriptional regulator [Pelovirga terrestris]